MSQESINEVNFNEADFNEFEEESVIEIALNNAKVNENMETSNEFLDSQISKTPIAIPISTMKVEPFKKRGFYSSEIVCADIDSKYEQVSRKKRFKNAVKKSKSIASIKVNQVLNILKKDLKNGNTIENLKPDLIKKFGGSEFINKYIGELDKVIDLTNEINSSNYSNSCKNCFITSSN